MKYTFNLLVGILIFIPFTKVDAQVFATGQANTSYIYPIIDENGPERLFTGLSAEIGAEGETMSILLKSGVYIPRNYIFDKYIGDIYSGNGYETSVEQRISIYELGLYGRYYLIGMQGNAVRVFTNSGLEMVWARGRDEYYDIYTDAQTIYKFTNKQLRVVLGAGFEVEIGDNLYLVNDFLFKYPFTDNYGDIMFIDVASDFAFNYNVGIKIFLN